MAKRKAPKKKTPKAKTGRPSAYRKDFDRIAYAMCLLGATDPDLAAALGVTVTTINNWKKAHPSFVEALKQGKGQADARVAESLFRRALGYEHDAVKIVADAKTGAHLAVPYVERYPPDTTACIFWLKNRQRDKWRDKQDHELTGKDGENLSLNLVIQRGNGAADADAAHEAG